MWWPASPPPALLRDGTTGEDSKVAVTAAMDASSAACFRRWKMWPHPRLIRLFLPLLSGTVGSVVVVVVALTGEPLRRPGESAHCVLLDPSRRTEPVRGSSGECGLVETFLGVAVAEPLDASLHSEPELATSAAASRDASLRRSDGATRPGVSVTPAGLVDGRKRMERPNAWLTAPPFPDVFPIFRASASASAKRGSSVQLRCRERARGASSLTRWSASVATDDNGGGGAEDKGDGAGGALLLPLLLPVEEEGQSARAIETATGEGDVVVVGSDRETERRPALWRTGESAEAGRGNDRPASSVPEADVHRFEDDMAGPARARHARYALLDKLKRHI